MRYYILPVDTVGNARGPKYFKWGPSHPGYVGWKGMDYGNEPVMLVAADLPPADHAVLAAQPDVIAAGIAAMRSSASVSLGD